ncbi:hypothetical protein M3P19_15615 [Muricauda sp. 2012CJ35-5]|uniref:GAF domain-containing protein n=1 Tax=Flagellimonas spongiicola TaxID=2942208 RepID=A0ABT0PVP9_9FLAO|nr:hypothetical protein [Allomuricauda spongiicola]MCL6275442.1 hypothetical protein [Allomuricauda spongiicola]
MRLLAPIITLLSSILGIISFANSTFGELDAPQRNIVFFVVLVLFITGMYGVFQIWRDKKIHQKHVQATSSINQAISRLIYDYSEKELEDNFEELLNHFSKIYFNLKKVECVLTIKMVVENDLVTIAHSNNKPTLKREWYYKGNSLPLNLAIGTCTDVGTIFGNFDTKPPREVYYYAKNLLKEIGFHHPAINDIKFGYKEKVDAEPWYMPNYFKRERNWPLKYKSTIVVPVTPMVPKDQQRESNDNGIIGLLCINANAVGVFNEGFDLHIMQMLAEVVRTFFIANTKGEERRKRLKELLQANKDYAVELGKAQLEITALKKHITQLEKQLKEKLNAEQQWKYEDSKEKHTPKEKKE